MGKNVAQPQTMEKFFNTAGPSREDLNYMIDPLRRIDYDEVSALIATQRYFVLHAPRQTGKTTSLLAMVKKINEEGQYRCVYINVEPAQMARNDIDRGMRAILSELGQRMARSLGDPEPYEWFSSILEKDGALKALGTMLTRICTKSDSDKSLVLFIDEIDSLIGDTLVSVLRQLRGGYATRPQEFPISVILCGVRDIRDYRIHMASGEIITGGSCFNIKAESLRLGDFSQDEIRELYEQHTAATGQIFEENIYPTVWDLTHGQPWLVNALARQATQKMSENRDRSKPITLGMIEEAANQLILERATHLDQLADKLREERVRQVIAPMIAGENWAKEAKPSQDDLQYVLDLGLIRNDRGNYVVSNAIYREVLPRELSYVMEADQTSRPTQEWYIKPNGELDMTKLLREFQQFFRENIESWKEGFDYKEAGFQLLLQAFLQRIVNGGGLIGREYALGSGRVDLLVRWRYPKDTDRREQQEQRIVLELKTIRASSHDPNKAFSEGREQTTRYAEQSNAAEAHLIICDERAGRGWDEKIYDRLEHYPKSGESGTKEIHIWGV
jgi:hypothetical protein